MARKSAPINVSRLAPPLVVLRKVDVRALSRRLPNEVESTWDFIGKGQVDAGVNESETVWYGEGLILNDQPRSGGVTDEIIANTLGFAVARTDNGEIVDEYPTLVAAEAAVASARLSVNVSVEQDDPEDEIPADFDPETGSFGSAHEMALGPALS